MGLNINFPTYFSGALNPQSPELNLDHNRIDRSTHGTEGRPHTGVKSC